jgi:hypothetical protein
VSDSLQLLISRSDKMHKRALQIIASPAVKSSSENRPTLDRLTPKIRIEM